MLSNVGSLRTPTVGPIEKAVDYAFALVAGWAEPDRGEIRRSLNDLKAASEHNEAIYNQASAALKELSAENAKNLELIAEGDKARAYIEEARRIVGEINALEN